MSQDRLDRLTTPVKERSEHSQRYSLFIRRARLIMPVIALIIIAMVFVWGSLTQETIVPVQESTLNVKTVGKNELINPRFESRDEKDQPLTVTATRALQDAANNDLVLLDAPKASMTLTQGDIVGAQATSGEYQQDSQKLLLSGAVKLTHNEGYTLDTEKLYIDMVENKSWSDDAVYAQGPKGTLEAKGLRADSAAQTLRFLGPAKMTLNSGTLKLKPSDKK